MALKNKFEISLFRSYSHLIYFTTHTHTLTHPHTHAHTLTSASYQARKKFFYYFSENLTSKASITFASVIPLLKTLTFHFFKIIFLFSTLQCTEADYEQKKIMSLQTGTKTCLLYCLDILIQWM
jgi:hypothetical protein